MESHNSQCELCSVSCNANLLDNSELDNRHELNSRSIKLLFTYCIAHQTNLVQL